MSGVLQKAPDVQMRVCGAGILEIKWSKGQWENISGHAQIVSYDCPPNFIMGRSCSLLFQENQKAPYASAQQRCLNKGDKFTCDSNKGMDCVQVP